MTTKTFKIKNQSTSFANVNIDIIDRHFHHLFIYNGHSYAVSRVPFSWSRIIEISKITKGYPIKISSNEENSEIRKHFASLTSYRSLLIGLTDVEEEGDWKWFDSSRREFTRWADGEPSDSNANEDFAGIVLKSHDGRYAGQWNDHPPSNTYENVKRVIFEWDFELK